MGKHEMMAVLRDGNPMNLNYGLFIPAINLQGTEEQQVWAEKAYRLKIIGTYAMVYI